MAIGDIYQVIDNQTWGAGGEKFSNVWFYRALDAACSAQDLQGAWGSTAGMLGLVAFCQTLKVQHVSVQVMNLFSLTDFFEGSVNLEGELPGQALPMHSALNFTLKLNTRGIRPGSKRISGLSEAGNEDGIMVGTTEVGNINALAAAMSVDIAGEGSAAYEHVVVKRIATEVAATEERPAHTEYSLPENVGELNYGRVVAALVNLHISHQTSRGNGR